MRTGSARARRKKVTPTCGNAPVQGHTPSRRTKERQCRPAGDALRQPNCPTGEPHMATTTNKKTVLEQDKQMIEGTQQHLSNQTVIVGDNPYTAQQIVDVYQGRVTKSLAAATAKADWQAAVKADREERAQTGLFTRAFRNIVLGMFHSPSTLANF